MKRLPDPDWFAVVRVGDVLRTPKGALRVIRHITRRDGRPWAFQFVKRRCSRWQSPTTVYFRHELRRWEYVGARVKLDQPYDRDVALHCQRHGDGVLRQCDVVGVLP